MLACSVPVLSSLAAEQLGRVLSCNTVEELSGVVLELEALVYDLQLQDRSKTRYDGWPCDGWPWVLLMVCPVWWSRA